MKEVEEGRRIYTASPHIGVLVLSFSAMKQPNVESFDSPKLDHVWYDPGLWERHQEARERSNRAP